MATRMLYEALNSQRPDLAREFVKIYDEAIEIWKEQAHRDFTAHGKVHMERVERNLDALIMPLKNSASLSMEEIFVLLSASCLHDIGMQRADRPDAREKHAQYSYELILKSNVRGVAKKREIILSINDNNARRVIANLARAHWTEFALKLEATDFIWGNEKGRLRLLGLLLAMADLLDISPERARYFRSVHRLYTLDPLSELHQEMHDLTRGFEIVTLDPTGELQFRLEWNDNSVLVQTMCKWLIRWFNSQHRQLAPALENDSSGLIRWTRPWAVVKFNPPEEKRKPLKPQVRHVLRAERVEQLRIDRDKFTKRFKKSIELGEVALFLYPSDPDWDWRVMSEWCEANANLAQNCRVARVEALPDSQKDISSIVADIMEQWGEHLPESDDETALESLKDYVAKKQNHALVSIIVAKEYQRHLIDRLVKVLLHRPAHISGPARICLLLTYGGQGPSNLRYGEIIRFDKSPLSPIDVERHLQTRCGYTETESKNFYRDIEQLGFGSRPGKLYTFIDIRLRDEASIG